MSKGAWRVKKKWLQEQAEDIKPVPVKAKPRKVAPKKAAPKKPKATPKSKAKKSDK